MIKACEEAKESIDLEQFIFVPDDLGNRLIDVCSERAANGVKVRFIWDAAGSWSFFGAGIISDLAKKGIELVFFKTLFPKIFDAHDYKSWYFRNHRRTLVVDGKTAFTGSICIYEKMKDWRDTCIKIQGPVVRDMQDSFNRMWLRAQGKRLPKIKIHKYHDHEFRYVTNTPIPGHKRLYNNLVDSVRGAEKSIFLTTPYFVPTRRLAKTLRLQAQRGVDVRILMPSWSDNTLVDLCARTFFNSMLKSGVKIFLYKEGMLHAKTMIIDGKKGGVGTMNLDNVSLNYNFEANIVSENVTFAEELTKHFMHDLEKSEEMTFEKWKNRYWVEKIASFFMRFVRGFF